MTIREKLEKLSESMVSEDVGISMICREAINELDILNIQLVLLNKRRVSLRDRLVKVADLADRVSQLSKGV